MDYGKEILTIIITILIFGIPIRFFFDRIDKKHKKEKELLSKKKCLNNPIKKES